ncbi:hypothetical protein N431DRAFT_489360 [Stipitochalara longipes BDJ]|nr:hypothetical protein N431DRAFT_489360 [Stipitochalara longipes BDJ]
MKPQILSIIRLSHYQSKMHFSTLILLAGASVLQLPQLIQASPFSLEVRQSCTPGTYECPPGDDPEIWVCGGNGQWETAAVCGSDQFCFDDNGIPVCVNAG